MEIKVVFTTQLKAALGTGSQSLSLGADATVRDAIAALGDEHRESFRTLVVAQGGELLPSILLSLNDQQVEPSERLSDGDTLTILSAISGG